MIRISIAILAAGAIAAECAEDPQLAGIRNLAAGMLKHKQVGADSASVEYAPTSQVEGCSGPNRNAMRYRIGRPGAVESWVYRSPRESGRPIGFYRGRIDDKQWRALLQSIAAMRWTEAPAGPPGLSPPPPGPTETISVLRLFDGKKIAEYGKSGPAPDPISAAFAQPGILARGATDTVWQLSLVKPKAEIRKDSVCVAAEWKWRGPAGARILFNPPEEGDFCGVASFRWFLDTTDFGADWHMATATPDRRRGVSWDLPDPKSNAFRLCFPYEGPKGKAKRVGQLNGMGIRLIPGGSRDTISATVFTDRFEF